MHVSDKLAGSMHQTVVRSTVLRTEHFCTEFSVILVCLPSTVQVRIAYKYVVCCWSPAPSVNSSVPLNVRWVLIEASSISAMERVFLLISDSFCFRDKLKT